MSRARVGRRDVLRLIVPAILSFVGTAWSALPAAAADTFVVRSTGNDHDASLADPACDADPDPAVVRCTLRAAIEQANGDPDEDRIEFRIGGARATGVKVIPVLIEKLSAITAPLVIDGYTQPDSRLNTASRGTNARPRIVLEGPGGSIGLDIQAPSTIRGLVLHGFDIAIRVAAGPSVISGDFIGTNATGTRARPNGAIGISVEAGAVRIGGSTSAARNIISATEGPAISVYHDDGRVRIQGNLIGVDADGSGDLGNQGAGIIAESADVLRIGGTRSAQANVIAHNTEHGIVLLSGSEGPILRNSIFDNGGLAIDLDGDGPTPNDGASDSDFGSNELQNFPVITSATNRDGVTTIRGRLASMPNRSYRIEFFSNPAGTDEARSFIGSLVVGTGATGSVRFRFRPAKRVRAGRYVTATATDVVGGWTSEVSEPNDVDRLDGPFQ
jgi:hypothetical protein